MKNFILDKNPDIESQTVKIGTTSYVLCKADPQKFAGYVFTSYEKGKAPDSVCLTKENLKALFFLLYTP